MKFNVIKVKWIIKEFGKVQKSNFKFNFHIPRILLKIIEIVNEFRLMSLKLIELSRNSVN